MTAPSSNARPRVTIQITTSAPGACPAPLSMAGRTRCSVERNVASVPPIRKGESNPATSAAITAPDRTTETMPTRSPFSRSPIVATLMPEMRTSVPGLKAVCPDAQVQKANASGRESRQVGRPPDQRKLEQSAHVVGPTGRPARRTAGPRRARARSTWRPTRRSGIVLRLLFVQFTSSQMRWSGSISTRWRRSFVVRINRFQRSAPSQSTRSFRPLSKVNSITWGSTMPPRRRTTMTESYGVVSPGSIASVSFVVSPSRPAVALAPFRVGARASS